MRLVTSAAWWRSVRFQVFGQRLLDDPQCRLLIAFRGQEVVTTAGALLGQAPSAHTLKTPYFPLALYQRDTERAARLRETLAHQMTMPELAVRFALTHPNISSAIIGFGSASHVAEVTGLPLTELR